MDAASTDADAEYDADVRRVFSLRTYHEIALLIFLAALTCPCLADGGEIVLHQISENFEITVFATPTPLVAGDADLSVLVQDAASHQAIAGTQIELALYPPSGPVQSATAKHPQASNQLFQAMLFHFNQPGLWTITVTVRHSGKIQVASARFQILPSHSRALTLWICLMIPPVAIALFTLHQRQKYILRHPAGRSRAKAGSV